MSTHLSLHAYSLTRQVLLLTFVNSDDGAKLIAGLHRRVIAIKQDYDLSAVFMRNWDTRDESGTDKGCEWEKDWEDVRRVCESVGLPCEMVRPHFFLYPFLN